MQKGLGVRVQNLYFDWIVLNKLLLTSINNNKKIVLKIGKDYVTLRVFFLILLYKIVTVITLNITIENLLLVCTLIF